MGCNKLHGGKRECASLEGGIVRWRDSIEFLKIDYRVRE
jgi:hypothetical protein